MKRYVKSGFYTFFFLSLPISVFAAVLEPTKVINLKALISDAPTICANSAYLLTRKDLSSEYAELNRIDLNSFAVKSLTKMEYLNANFDCDPKTGNYYVTDIAEQTDQAGILAYAPGVQEEFLWRLRFDESYHHPLVEDIIISKNQNIILVRLFHLGESDENHKENLPSDLYAVNKETGKIIWKLTPGPLRFETTIINDNFYITDTEGNITAYNLSDAKLKWHYKCKYRTKYQKPQFDEVTNTLITYFGSSGVAGEEAEIIGIDPEKGTQKWQIPEHKFFTLAKYNAPGTLTYSTTDFPPSVKWFSLNTGTPTLVDLWKRIFDEHLGDLTELLKIGNTTFTVFHSHYAKQSIYKFKNGSKFPQILERKIHANIFITHWNNSAIYVSEEGECGLLDA